MHLLLLRRRAARAVAPHSRRSLLRELTSAALHTGDYRNSHEELTPLVGDPIAVATLAVLSTALLLHPNLHTRLANGSVANYALTPAGWNQLIGYAAGDRLPRA